MKNQKGFGAMELVIVFVIALLVGIVGYYAWERYTGSDKVNNDVSSFEECKNAGFPIMESYPEQCNANGKSFTNPDQNVDYIDTYEECIGAGYPATKTNPATCTVNGETFKDIRDQ